MAIWITNSQTLRLTCSLQVSYSFLTVGCEGADWTAAAAVGAVVDAFSFLKAASLSALSLAICSLTLSLINGYQLKCAKVIMYKLPCPFFFYSLSFSFFSKFLGFPQGHTVGEVNNNTIHHAVWRDGHAVQTEASPLHWWRTPRLVITVVTDHLEPEITVHGFPDKVSDQIIKCSDIWNFEKW